MTAVPAPAMHVPRDVAAVADVVRAAAAERRGLRIAGAGRWAGADSPAAAVRGDADVLCLTALSGIVAYVPGDLTLTARAGTTLAEIDEVTRAHGQWCPLVPWGDDAGTIGATFATATSGPLSDALGRPRDLALGLEFVDGEGTVARGGGRVVKNVAGFDLVRLMVGAFGTLGVLTEVTMRLRARPAADVTLIVTPDSAAWNAAAAADALRSADVAPVTAVAFDDDTADALSVPRASLVVRYMGNAAYVRAGRAAAARAGVVRDGDPAIWTGFRAREHLHRRERYDDPFATSVARRLKERFDPAGILNPGIFGEGRP
jgi:glycolate oxidase FAD binding subunit